MTKPHEFLKNIAEEINGCETKEEKLETLIFYGKNIAPFNDADKNEQNRVPGCNSDTFLMCKQTSDGIISFEGDSNSLIVKGYLFIFINAFSGLTASHAVNFIRQESEQFIKDAHIDESLMPSRTNTFMNIYLQMEKLAKAHTL